MTVTAVSVDSDSVQVTLENPVMAKRRKANADQDADGTKQSKRRDYEWINGTKEFPILTNGKLMDTPVFHPTEEEFSSFYEYAQKLDRWEPRCDIFGARHQSLIFDYLQAGWAHRGLQSCTSARLEGQGRRCVHFGD